MNMSYLLTGLGGICALAAVVMITRQWLRHRFALIEDSVRTYNTANVSIGQHVTALENEVQELRKRLQRIESATAAPARGAVQPPRQRVPARAAVNEEFTEAELRLAQRLKAGLGSLRLG